MCCGSARYRSCCSGLFYPCITKVRAMSRQDGMVCSSKSEAMVFNGKEVECSLRLREKSLPQVEEFKYLRILFMREGNLEQEMDSWSFISCNEGAVPVCCGEEGAELKCEAFGVLVHRCSNCHLWSWDLGSDQKNDVEMGSLWMVDGLSLRDKVRSLTFRRSSK